MNVPRTSKITSLVLAVSAAGVILAACQQSGGQSTAPQTIPNTPAATTPTVSCTPAQGETVFSGKVAFMASGQSGQYTLQASGGKTYYLRTNDQQSASLKNKLNKNGQVNGTLVAPNSGDVNVTTVCP